MTTTLKAALKTIEAERRAVSLAKKAAAVFVDEFPGETLHGSDWDSAAWEIDQGSLPDECWPVYQAALRHEVDRHNALEAA